jgi:hypothetical protein
VRTLQQDEPGREGGRRGRLRLAQLGDIHDYILLTSRLSDYDQTKVRLLFSTCHHSFIVIRCLGNSKYQTMHEIIPSQFLDSCKYVTPVICGLVYDSMPLQIWLGGIIDYGGMRVFLLSTLVQCAALMNRSRINPPLLRRCIARRLKYSRLPTSTYV